MINPKNIAISACVGFFLSFFIGLVSDVRFSHVLLRAFFFALVFAALCVGISFIYQRFLSNDNGSFSVEADSPAAKTAGGVVNIVVDDSALVDDGITPKFTVMNNHALKAEKPASVQANVDSAASSGEGTSPSASEHSVLAEEAPAKAQASEPSSVSAASGSDSSFKPMNLNEVSAAPSPASAGESAPPVSSAAVSSTSGENASGEQLDELPDIAGMGEGVESAGSDSDDSSSNDEVINDTEFATGGAKLREQPISGDTNVMAKAIQTLLAQDNN